ncbi:MAG: hypothetical protein HY741_02865 [Chloroflexi bacterium]|nr:hypothetical protein [Chloroflexota bacterium]
MSAENHNQLKQNVLTTWDVISQSLAFLGPVMSMAFLTGYIAIAAGAGTPLAVLLGGLTMVALGYVIAQFASRVHAAEAAQPDKVSIPFHSRQWAAFRG